MNKRINSYSDLERLELLARRIAESGVDITSEYQDWVSVTFACASLGEQARESYHTICSRYPQYSREECDRQFDNCLRTGRGDITLGTIMKMVKDHGIDTSLPRGRRPKSQQEKEEEQQTRISRMIELLRKQAEWRFNTWRQRPELKEPGQGWRPLQDRDLDTIYCRLMESGLKVKQVDVKAMIFSRDFCDDFDAFNEWLDGLPTWNPDTDPDYLGDFYKGHLEFVEKESEDFCVEMLKKWHMGMVALIKGYTNENPLMPIFKGPQRIGKTYFVRHILPPHLRDYRLEVGPAERIDRDFIISLSETPLIIFDEMSFGNTQKNEAYKYIVTSTKSNVRDAYAHFRESRPRRASLIATTNEDNFIPNSEGTRRYLVVDINGTVDLDNFPLPYEGAYAQALYLLNHDFNPKPNHDESLLISQHNRHYTEYNDCEEVLATILKKPDGRKNALAMSAGDILTYLSQCGHRGREFNTSEIGKAMKRMGFESKKIHGRPKYLVAKLDPDLRDRENEADSKEFIPEEI